MNIQKVVVLQISEASTVWKVGQGIEFSHHFLKISSALEVECSFFEAQKSSKKPVFMSDLVVKHHQPGVAESLCTQNKISPKKQRY